MQEEVKKSGAEVRKVGDRLLYGTSRLQIEFSADKEESLTGSIRVVNLESKRYHLDRFNLELGPRRKTFIKTAVPKVELSYSEIETLLDQFLIKLTDPPEKKQQNGQKRITLTDKERQWGESFLKNKNMIGELLEDFKSLGCLGEEISLLTCYLIGTSRLLDKTLAGVITSQSCMGKSFVLDTVWRLFPKEEREIITRSSATSLYYQPEGGLKHKLMVLVEQVGSSQLSYAIRCLLSDGYLNNMVTMRDPKTGAMTAKVTRTEGPTAILSTTTVNHLDEETQSRFFRLTVDMSDEQTRRVLEHERRNSYLKRLDKKYRTSYVDKKHHAAQRLLKPIDVVNPYCTQLTFKDNLHRFRREQGKYLRLMDAITLLRQHQKEIHYYELSEQRKSIPYICTDLTDIELANRLAEKILALTLDELSPPARNLLSTICKNVRRVQKEQGICMEEVRFTRREIRDWGGWSEFQVKSHVKELEDLEYLKVHRGQAGVLYQYSLLYSGDPEKEDLFNVGLVNVEKLRQSQHQNGNGSRLSRVFTQLVGGG